MLNMTIWGVRRSEDHAEYDDSGRVKKRKAYHHHTRFNEDGDDDNLETTINHPPLPFPHEYYPQASFCQVASTKATEPMLVKL